MLEVGRMPEHNVAESRSHISAWAIVSSPLTLGFDLTDESKMKSVWPLISNKRIIEISQTWVENAPQPTGRLIKQWQAPNIPTIVAPSCKCRPGGTNRNHECVDRDCSVCSPGNLSDDGIRGANQSWPGMENIRGWWYDATGKTFSIEAAPMQEDTQHHNRRKVAPKLPSGAAASNANSRLCLDTRGQLPGGLNYQHVLPCDGSGTQQWDFNTSSGQLKSYNDSTKCLQGAEWWTWLGRPLIILGACQINATTGLAPPSQRWSLQELTGHDGALLTNEEFGCVGVSFYSGPPSTIWSKPLEGGRTAVLAINGADLEQKLELDLGMLLGHGEGKSYYVHDVWKGENATTPLGMVTAVLPPHDCVVLVVRPQ